ncbi:MAG: asparagine synthase (glutamine-hydrolyzing) [Desulfobacterales bacterium]|nr:asparagine synthase (glutamine-hydrolyzing) [Desulfobacterales bacterium]
MCGIAGFSCRRRFDSLKNQLPGAARTLSHRGPDDSGLFFSEGAGVGMAHQRLSIIDLSSAGHQPMTSDDGAVRIVYNGEVYNFLEIRKELEGVGHAFRSNTDTEVILKAYLQWGFDCLEKFVGMFAFAIWDSRKRLFFMARDRLGIKPLYYHFHNGLFLFASELKAIAAFDEFKKNVDPDAVPLFLHYQYIPAPRTIFKHTQKLMPGHFLVLDDNGLHERAYWSIPIPKGEQYFSDWREEDHLQHLDRLLTRAVSDRLVSDVPLGALLSGGIDSSMVVALMQKTSNSTVKTFSIGVRDRDYNEAPWAAKVAAHLGTDHTELEVTPEEALNLIPRLPETYDEPYADSSAIPTLLVSHLTRSRVTVALSGDGGDEQFSGYIRYWSTDAMARTFQRLPATMKNRLAGWLEQVPTPWVEACYRPFRPYLPQQFNVANFTDKWQKLIFLMRHSSPEDLYRMTVCLWSSDEVRQLIGRGVPDSRFEALFHETEGNSLLSRVMRVDQGTYLPDGMLTKVDRASMAASLEIRVPLLDHRVVEYTATLPDHLKYRNGSGKYLLKKLLARYLPRDLFERPKMGFSVPIDRWFRKELKELLLDYLSPNRLNKEGLFDSELVQEKIAEHLSGRCSHQHRLWSLLMWEMWRERWIG